MLNTKTHEKVPSQLIFELVSVMLLGCAALVESSFTGEAWFTAVYAFACVTTSLSWYRARHILAPKLTTLLGAVLGRWLTVGMPVILGLASAAHMLHRST